MERFCWTLAQVKTNEIAVCDLEFFYELRSGLFGDLLNLSSEMHGNLDLFQTGCDSNLAISVNATRRIQFYWLCVN